MLAGKASIVIYGIQNVYKEIHIAAAFDIFG